MIKRLAVTIASFLLLSTTARAEICLGANSESLTREQLSAGDQLVKWEVQECGGGIGPTGAPVGKWKCFVQTWSSKGETFHFLYIADPKNPKAWALLHLVAPDGADIPLPACMAHRPSPEPLPGRKNGYEGEQVDPTF